MRNPKQEQLNIHGFEPEGLGRYPNYS